LIEKVKELGVKPKKRRHSFSKVVDEPTLEAEYAVTRKWMVEGVELPDEGAGEWSPMLVVRCRTAWGKGMGEEIVDSLSVLGVAEGEQLVEVLQKWLKWARARERDVEFRFVGEGDLWLYNGFSKGPTSLPVGKPRS
jgi:hypothetical protein